MGSIWPVSPGTQRGLGLILWSFCLQQFHLNLRDLEQGWVAGESGSVPQERHTYLWFQAALGLLVTELKKKSSINIKSPAIPSWIPSYARFCNPWLNSNAMMLSARTLGFALSLIQAWLEPLVKDFSLIRGICCHIAIITSLKTHLVSIKSLGGFPE